MVVHTPVDGNCGPGAVWMHEHLEAERPPTPKELQKYRKGMCEEALRFINGLKKSDAKEVRKAAMMLESNILAEMHAIMDGPRSRKRNREQMEMTLEIAMKCFSKTGTWMHVGLIGAACAAKGLGCQFWTLNEEGKAVLLEDPVLTAVDQAMWNGKQAPKSMENTVNVISVSAGGRVTRGNDINSIIEWKPKTAGGNHFVLMKMGGRCTSPDWELVLFCACRGGNAWACMMQLGNQRGRSRRRANKNRPRRRLQRPVEGGKR